MEGKLLRRIQAGCGDGCGEVVEMDEGRSWRWKRTGFQFI
jgi:hypothetical protein